MALFFVHVKQCEQNIKLISFGCTGFGTLKRFDTLDCLIICLF